MVSPEWSPDETYLRKLERLAYALVRTKPPKEQFQPESCIPRRRKNFWMEKTKGLAGPFALALLVAIPYIAENSSGLIILAALLLAALDAMLTVWCYTDLESYHGHCPSDLFHCLFSHVGEFPAFLAGWWTIAGCSAGVGAAARSLSALMDAVTGRHVETLMENTIGSFTPFGSPPDIISVGVVLVPSIMCSLGMEDSNLLRSFIFGLTSIMTLVIFSYALVTNHLFPSDLPPTMTTPDGIGLTAKIFAGASLACVGFLGLYTVHKPDNLTLTQHKHFNVKKRTSHSGVIVSAVAFFFYFVESSVINRVQQTPSVWDGDPPLLWPLEGGWRLVVASIGITVLCLATFEFLVPLNRMVTKLADDGLLYRKLKTPSGEEPNGQWNPTTPLLFGGLSAIQAMFMDTKVLLGLASSSLLCIHILVSATMVATRYKVAAPPLTIKRTATRPRPRAHSQQQQPNGHSQTQNQPEVGCSRRLLAVSLLRSGLGRLPREIVHEIEICGEGGCSVTNSIDRQSLITEPGRAEIRRESVVECSSQSQVSGYESESDVGGSVSGGGQSSEGDESGGQVTEDTDIDAAVTEYQENVRVATLNGTMPDYPTAATSRRVALALLALIPCCLALAVSASSPGPSFTASMLAISSGLLTFLLLVVISRQPQRLKLGKSSSKKRRLSGPELAAGENFFDGCLVPWAPVGAVFLHCCLLLQGLDLAATPFAFWLAIGLIIYFSYSVSKSIAAPRFDFDFGRESLRLGAPLMSTRPTTSAEGQQSQPQMDSVLLA